MSRGTNKQALKRKKENMNSESMTMVLVKMKQTGEDALKMEMMEIYPSNASIPLVDFNNETVVVTATIGMLNGDSLEHLEDVAKRFYINALESYVKNQLDIMNLQTKLKFLAYILMTTDFSDSMNGVNKIADMNKDEMMEMIKKDCISLYDLYITLTSCYEFIWRNDI